MYEKHKVAMIFCTDVINKYCELTNKFQKCTGITWIYRKQKNWTMEYCILHAFLWGLNIITTSKMERRSIQLGSNNIVYLLNLSVEKLNPRQITESVITNLLRDAKEVNLIIFGELYSLIHWGRFHLN